MYMGQTTGFGGLEKDLKEAGENINNIMSNYKDYKDQPNAYYNVLAVNYNRLVTCEKSLGTLDKQLLEQYSSFIIHSHNTLKSPFKNTNAMHHYENELSNLVIEYGYRKENETYKTLVKNAYGAYKGFSDKAYSKNKAYFKEFHKRVVGENKK